MLGQADQAAAATQQEDYSKDRYGNMQMIQSRDKPERELVQIKDVNGEMDGQKVWLRGRLHTSRAVGQNYCLSWNRHCV